jgi:hypothetical protein
VFVALFSLLLLVGCQTLEVKPEQPVVEKPIKTILPKQEWTDHLVKEIKAQGLDKLKASDEKEFCPNGMNTENWAHLIAAMAKRESSLRPNTEYRENFKNSKGEYIISTGLLQISLESSKGYKCGMNSQADLKDPLKNLSCGVTILARWIKRDGCIACGSHSVGWKGIQRYWSVGRYKLDKLKDYVSPYCQ